MTKYKKVITLVLACILTFSCFSMSAFALVSESEINSSETICSEETHRFDSVQDSDEYNPQLFINRKSAAVYTTSIRELPADTEAFCYQCNVCNKKTASSTLKTPESDGTYGSCYYSECDGKYEGYSICAKEYYYAFECTECGAKAEYKELPVGTEDAPYGKCKKCEATITEEMFSIDYSFKQYSRPCFYCFNVQLGTKSIYDGPNCPFCGECYDMVLPDSVDDSGNLIYGGGGSNLYYCTETEKFYQAPKDENGTVNDDCPYCDNHKPNKINILYCVICPSCGTRAERSHIDHYNRPYLMATLNNAFMSIGVSITGVIDPNDFDLSNRCYNCKYNFSEDDNLVITRHIDAPDGTVYDAYPNDRDYHETDTYLDEGSEYDSFIERIIWRIKKNIREIMSYLEFIFSNLY